MKRRRPYVVTLKEPGLKRPYFLHVCANSTSDAERQARKWHPRWRIVSIEVEVTL